MFIIVIIIIIPFFTPFVAQVLDRYGIAKTAAAAACVLYAALLRLTKLHVRIVRTYVRRGYVAMNVLAGYMVARIDERMERDSIQ